MKVAKEAPEVVAMSEVCHGTTYSGLAWNIYLLDIIAI
jgi:hypothetical protein